MRRTMPTYIQGDIFAQALDNHYDLAIVFGHLGLNEMAMAWREAQRRVPEWEAIHDPFENQAAPIISPQGETRLWWFVAAEQNNGMTDERFRQSVQALFESASDHGLTTILTNGISDVDHGIFTDANRASDNRRVHLINEIMTTYENRGFRVSLISLNDAYTRNFPQ
jgi:hypothetical protein